MVVTGKKLMLTGLGIVFVLPAVFPIAYAPFVGGLVFLVGLVFYWFDK